jgi:hypothetical protein
MQKEMSGHLKSCKYVLLICFVKYILIFFSHKIQCVFIKLYLDTFVLLLSYLSIQFH